MALGRQGERQAVLVVGWAELPRSPGHAFYDRLQAILVEAGFDGFAETQCAPHYGGKQGRPSLPPGRYFRMHLVGYFEGIDSERGLEWRCADSLSLREFLRLGTTEPVPDHSWLSKTRTRLPLEVQEMLHRLANASGIATPTADDLVRLDRNRTGKRLSNSDWASPSDPEAKIAKLKDGRTRLAYKPEHAVDLDSAAIVAAAIHPADQGDTTTLPETLQAAAANLAAVGAAPTPEDPAALIADKGYHSRDALKDLDDGAWKSRIAEKKVRDVSRWHGDDAARRAVYNNRARLRSGVAKEAFKLRAELVERSFALTLDRGGMRRAWLRGRENLHKRYLVHVAGYNLGLIMRLLAGAGTPREFLARVAAHLLVVTPAEGATIVILAVATDPKAEILAVSTEPAPPDRHPTSSTGC